jgi:hypothetical protein
VGESSWRFKSSHPHSQIGTHRHPYGHHHDWDAASKACRMTDDVRIWGLSKTQANYRPAPTREVRCARCKYMCFPRSLSAGAGWSGDRFEAPEHATTSPLAAASQTPCFRKDAKTLSSRCRGAKGRGAEPRRTGLGKLTIAAATGFTRPLFSGSSRSFTSPTRGRHAFRPETYPVPREGAWGPQPPSLPLQSRWWGAAAPPPALSSTPGSDFVIVE